MADKLYPKILSKNQQEVFDKFSFLTKHKFYLAGGTALALQIGHRTSVDFDFYKETKLKPDIIVPEFKKSFLIKDLNITEATATDLRIVIKNISFTAFYYPYPLIRNFINFSGVNLASIEDIAAMKIIAIVQRGRKRDFFDIYYLLKKYSLSQILSFVKEKHPEYDLYSCLRALTYYVDAEQELANDRIRLFDKTITWPKVKKIISTQVKNFCLSRGVKV